MNIGIGEHGNDHEPVNHKCPRRLYESNKFGYCHGNPSLIEDDFEYETRDDGHMVHEALQCENYMMKA